VVNKNGISAKKLETYPIDKHGKRIKTTPKAAAKPASKPAAGPAPKATGTR
jgi:hypothetical protein